MSEIAPEYVEGDQEDPLDGELLLPAHMNAGNKHRLLNALQVAGYDVRKEWSSDYQAVYNVHPNPDVDPPEIFQDLTHGNARNERGEYVARSDD